MGRPEKPIVPGSGPVADFALDLRELRASAGLNYRQMYRRVHFSVSTLARAASGEEFPSLAVTRAYVKACDGDEDEWTDRWRAVARELQMPSELQKPRELQMHSPVGSQDSPAEPASDPPGTDAAAAPADPSEPSQTSPARPARVSRRAAAVLAAALAAVIITVTFIIASRAPDSAQATTSSPNASAGTFTATSFPVSSQIATPASDRTRNSATDAAIPAAPLGPGCGLTLDPPIGHGNYDWKPVDGALPDQPGCTAPLYTKVSGSRPELPGSRKATADWSFHTPPGHACTLQIYVPVSRRADTRSTEYLVFSDHGHHEQIGEYRLDQNTAQGRWTSIGNSTTAAWTYATDTGDLDLVLTDASSGSSFLVADLARAACT